jgi:tricarballylate dehydrogenase
MGGGKALVNAYLPQRRQAWGARSVTTRRWSGIELEGRTVCGRPRKHQTSRRRIRPERIEARACVLAAGRLRVQPGDWLREAWGQNERGEWPDRQLPDPRHALQPGRAAARYLLDARRRPHRRPDAGHMVAIDARAPLYDGGICTRIDCVSLGVVVNRRGRCASTTRARTSGPSATRSGAGLVAQQPGRRRIRSSTPRPSAASCRRCSRA